MYTFEVFFFKIKTLINGKKTLHWNCFYKFIWNGNVKYLNDRCINTVNKTFNYCIRLFVKADVHAIQL